MSREKETGFWVDAAQRLHGGTNATWAGGGRMYTVNWPALFTPSRHDRTWMVSWTTYEGVMPGATVRRHEAPSAVVALQRTLLQGLGGHRPTFMSAQTVCSDNPEVQLYFGFAVDWARMRGDNAGASFVDGRAFDLIRAQVVEPPPNEKHRRSAAFWDVAID